MRQSRTFIALWAFTLGCASVEESEYTTELAVAVCRTTERCALGLFESAYGELDDCVDQLADGLDDVVDEVYDACDYDGDEAASCIQRIRGMSCEDWATGDDEDACDLVYDCTGAL